MLTQKKTKKKPVATPKSANWHWFFLVFFWFFRISKLALVFFFGSFWFFWHWFWPEFEIGNWFFLAQALANVRNWKLVFGFFWFFWFFFFGFFWHLILRLECHPKKKPKKTQKKTSRYTKIGKLALVFFWFFRISKLALVFFLVLFGFFGIGFGQNSKLETGFFWLKLWPTFEIGNWFLGFFGFFGFFFLGFFGI